MEKPIEVKIEETRAGIINTISGFQLPHFIAVQILGDLYKEYKKASKQLTIEIKQKYKEELVKEEIMKEMQSKQDIDSISETKENTQDSSSTDQNTDLNEVD